MKIKKFNQIEKDTPISDEIVKLDTNKLSTLNSIPVENSRKVLSYICANIKRSISLSRQLTEELTEIFGKHNTTFRGEFFHKIWILKYKNHIFEVFSSKRGTTFQIVKESEGTTLTPEEEDISIEFLQKIGTLINK